MIDVKDLRIGNLVMHRNKVSVIGSLVSVESAPQWGDGRVGFHQETLTAFSQNSIDPIPLSEEWLARLGFVVNKDVHYPMLFKDCYGVWETNGDWHFGIEDGSLRVVKYIHEVMNLYYLLSEQELTIKESKKNE